ncbi:lanthionine synthetase LanC family protein [Parabacteroides sp. Marseille-P3160]|uniref:lanthionine synthetase LanC family protein n=1 Tax=Parabacteroides sp. Marseille-P3160 TaxID=1917887 RepID=UPI0009BB524D|nr:lanthionine synthetase LanC family protein [Parabacteroides sp. Marseille-P3160]
MNTKTENTTVNLLTRVGRYLMLHASYTDNIGLLNGKTGIAIFFFHYARYTKMKLYEKFAGELLDEIYDEIHTHISTDFKDGLCGIAWGIEYLIQNGFVKGETDEILEELDKQILERNVRRIMDNSLETGLKGIAAYAISRNTNMKNNLISKEYINDLIWALYKNVETDKENEALISQLEKMAEGIRLSMNGKLLAEKINKTIYSPKTLFNDKRPLGIINNGFSGVGLKILGGIQR